MEVGVPNRTIRKPDLGVPLPLPPAPLPMPPLETSPFPNASTDGERRDVGDVTDDGEIL
jgi:hypothetical protein